MIASSSCHGSLLAVMRRNGRTSCCDNSSSCVRCRQRKLSVSEVAQVELRGFSDHPLDVLGSFGGCGAPRQIRNVRPVRSIFRALNDINIFTRLLAHTRLTSSWPA